MKKIGLTGNIASGKSTVENILKKLGCKVIDADNICHEAINTDKTIIEKIINIFEDKDILDEKGDLSRPKMAKIVFSSKTHREKLENILHPYVISKIEKFFMENQNENIVFASVPLLYEINIEKMFDKILFISAKENIRLERVMERNNLSKEEARKRIFAQNTEDDKIQKSDFVIYNNGNLDELYTSTISVFRKLQLL